MEQETEVEANEARGKPRVWFSKTHALKKKKRMFEERVNNQLSIKSCKRRNTNLIL